MTRSDSIRNIGLKNYLNHRSMLHHGKTYDDFLEKIKYKASINYMAREFGVSKNTMQKWIKIYHEETVSLKN